MVQFRVLGPLEVVDGGAPVDLGGPKVRRLLAALIVGLGRPVSTERLAEAVWYGEEEPAGASTLPSYVSRLRRRLGDSVEIERLGAGYQLGADDESIDAVRFQRLTERAEAVADLAETDRLLVEALDLWRGDAYEDYAAEGWARGDSARLDELRARAVELHVDAQLELGLHDRVIPELEAWIARWPLRERLRSQQMVALYRAGRQPEALRSYQSLRSSLADELGLSPSGELADLERQIAIGDTSLQTTSPTGQRLRSYRLRELIGRGRLGVVHRATQISVDREVAIKIVDKQLADDPGFIQSFEADANAIASLEHPHIVPLYDYWRDPTGAYLVMPYLPGRSVADRLGAELLAVELVVEWVTHVAGALDFAHQQGRTHRQVKPENVLIGGSGNAYLTDFSLSAEMVDGRAGDVRDLGVLAYRLLANDAGDSTASSTSTRLSKQRIVRPDLPSEVDAVLDIALDRARGFDSAREFATALAAAIASPGRPKASEPAPAVRRNPYKGLDAFQEADAADFYGREDLVAEALRLLTGPGRFVAVVGPSGSGKSSLVRAGVVPALRAKSGRYVVTMVPGADPFAELELALRGIAVDPAPTLAAVLRSGADGFVSAAELAVPVDDGELILVVDQFEELYTLVGDGDRRRFIDALLRSLDDERHRISVALTLRADFYDQPLRHPKLGLLISEHQVAVVGPRPEQLERVIAAPADGVGLAVEPALVANLVRQVADQPAALPLLQYALTDLFDHSDGVLTLDAYTERGELDTAIARRADAVYADLDDDGQTGCRRLFGQLVHIEDGQETTTRRRVELAEVLDDREVIDRFVSARLLALDRDDETREPTVEVAHEALIASWPRLRQWIDDDRDDLLIGRRLRVAAEEWDGSGRDPGGLYRGSRLQVASEWAARDTRDRTEVEAAFLAAGEATAAEERDRERSRVRRLRALLAAAAAALVVAGTLGVIALVQRNRANESATQAAANAVRADSEAEVARTEATRADAARVEATVQRLVTESGVALGEDPDLSILLALEAHDRAAAGGSLGDLSGSVSVALHSAVQSSRLVQRIDSGRLAAVVDPGGAVVASGDDRSSEVTLHDLETGGEVDRFDAGFRVGALAFSPDGSRLAVARRPTEAELIARSFEGPILRLFSTGDWSQLAEWTGSCCVGEMAFGVGGRYLAYDFWAPADLGQTDLRPVVLDLEDPEAAPLLVDAVRLAGWDERRVVAVGSSGVVWTDVDTGATEEAPIDGLELLLDDADLHPDGDRIFISTAGRAELWSLPDPVLLESFDHQVPAFLFGELSPDGSSLYLHGQDDEIVVVDLEAGATSGLRGHAGLVGTVSLSADGSTLVAASAEELHVWDVSRPGPAVLGNLDSEGFVLLLEPAPDGATALIGGWRGESMQVQLFDLTTGDVLATSPEYRPADLLSALSYPVGSASAMLTAGPTMDGRAAVHDLTDGSVVLALPECELPVAMDDRGQWLLVTTEAGCEGVGRLVEIATGRTVFEWPGPAGMGHFGPSGTVSEGLVVLQRGFVEGDPELELRRVETGEVVGEYRATIPWRPFFSADGRHVSFGSREQGGTAVDVERVLGGASMDDAVAVNRRVEGGATSFTIAGAEMMVTGHSGELLRFWDLDTGEAVMSLPVASAAPTMQAITSDGRYLYYADEGGLVRRLPLDVGELAELARSRVQRDFNVEECERFSITADCSGYE